MTIASKDKLFIYTANSVAWPYSALKKDYNKMKMHYKTVLPDLNLLTCIELLLIEVMYKKRGF